MSGKFLTYGIVVCCVNYRNGSRYCYQRSISLARGGKEAIRPNKFLAYLVVLCFETRSPWTKNTESLNEKHGVPERKTVAPLNDKLFGPKYIFGLDAQMQWSAFFVTVVATTWGIFCGAKQRRSQEFYSGGGSHLTYVRLFLPFIFEQLKLI